MWLGFSAGFVLVISAGLLWAQWYFSDSIALAAMRARDVTPEQAPQLHGVIDRLCALADMPKPRVAIAETDVPNAFATGRNPDNAVVCVTEGILKILDQDELEGVIAHELGHIQNRDMLLQTVSASLSGAITNLARLGGARSDSGLGPLAIIFAPIGAAILQFAISRSREFKADYAGAQISGKPLALASALEKLQAGAKRIPMRISPSVAPLAQVNPMAAFGGGISKLFSTHPSTEERIEKLRGYASSAGTP